jgi:hypothetical protein
MKEHLEINERYVEDKELLQGARTYPHCKRERRRRDNHEIGRLITSARNKKMTSHFHYLGDHGGSLPPSITTNVP